MKNINVKQSNILWKKLKEYDELIIELNKSKTLRDLGNYIANPFCLIFVQVDDHHISSDMKNVYGTSFRQS